jgi:hypothetical protein
VFEKLLSLLLHAKGGAVATVLVLGASGALVTATVQSGATTVTITQPSAATTGSDTTTGSTTTPNTTVTQTVLALFNRKENDDPTAPATGNGCSDAAHAMNVQVKAVNETFKTDHQAIEKQRKDAKTDAARKALNDADKVIRETRQAAVKAIHLLFKSDECKGNGDEDKDTEDTEDTEDADNDSTITVAISCTDAKACADAAIKAMNDEVTALTATLSALTTAPTAPKADTKKADTKSDNAKNATKGKGHSEGRSHQGDD